MTTETLAAVIAATHAAMADALIAAITPAKEQVAITRAFRVFKEAHRFPSGMFISTEDKAGFVVLSYLGTPALTPTVAAYLKRVVAQAKADFATYATTAEYAAEVAAAKSVRPDKTKSAPFSPELVEQPT